MKIASLNVGKQQNRGGNVSNKKLGNDFETELCDRLSKYGFWCHNMAMNKSGQPADVIAVRNGKAHLIDAKVCSNGKFALSRVEENQTLAMDLWNDCGNGIGWFAIKLDKFDSKIYMVSYYTINSYTAVQASLSAQEIFELGTPIEKWVEKCK